MHIRILVLSTDPAPDKKNITVTSAIFQDYFVSVSIQGAQKNPRHFLSQGLQRYHKSLRATHLGMQEYLGPSSSPMGSGSSVLNPEARVLDEP